MRGESPFLKPPRDDDADDEIGSRWSLFVVVAGIVRLEISKTAVQVAIVLELATTKIQTDHVRTELIDYN